MFDHEFLEQEIRDKQKSINYDLRSYTIGTIIEQFRMGDFYIPHYQRDFVWSKASQSLFIESMIIGLPTSTLFCAITDDYRAEILDGVQRVKTLESFVNGDLKLGSLEEIEALNGLTFFDLSRSQQRKFLNRSISFISLSEGTSFEARIEIFRRMNSGGKQKTYHEMRLATLDGPFIDFIRDISYTKRFESSINLSSFMKIRRENEEFAVRFFSLSNYLDKYRGNMNKFLDNCVKDLNANFVVDNHLEEFERTTVFVSKYFKDIFYSKKRKASRVVFDSIYVGVNLALRENPNLVPGSMEWMFSDEYDALITIHASQTPQRVKSRILFVKDMLLSRG